MERPIKIAVIGAGLCGLYVARRLRDMADVRIFEKSRGLGGRMSTRRAAPFQFDHGAQYFTAHDPRFQTFLAPFIDAGIVARWAPRLVSFGGGAQPAWQSSRYVAVPGMNAFCKAMGSDLDIARQTRIEKIARTGMDKWRLTDETGGDCGVFDWVICTAPAEQTAVLMPKEFSHYEAVAKARMQGCYSLMLGGLDQPELTWDAAVVENSPLAWIAANQSKPDRPQIASLICQSRNDWAEAHIEEDADAVTGILSQAVQTATGLSPASAEYISLHKWRFAKVAASAGQDFLLDRDTQLAAAGDWCIGGRVEAAFLSGHALSKELAVILQSETVSF